MSIIVKKFHSLFFSLSLFLIPHRTSLCVCECFACRFFGFQMHLCCCSTANDGRTTTISPPIMSSITIAIVAVFLATVLLHTTSQCATLSSPTGPKSPLLLTHLSSTQSSTSYTGTLFIFNLIFISFFIPKILSKRFLKL